MVALELLENMKQNMEGVQTISVPYHINQIKEGIDEIVALKTFVEDYKDAEKFVADPPHDQVCCGCVATLRVWNKKQEETIKQLNWKVEGLTAIIQCTEGAIVGGRKFLPSK